MRNRINIKTKHRLSIRRRYAISTLRSPSRRATSSLHGVVAMSAGVAIVAHINTQLFWRPWLELYDRRRAPCEVPAVLEALGADILSVVAHYAGPRAFARLACTCRAFNAFVSRAETIWRTFCFEAFAHREEPRETAKTCAERFGGSYRYMWKLRLRLRTDGIYCSRNTYIKPGTKTPTDSVPVHLVCYYRYFRFLPGRGSAFLCKTSPKTIRHEGKLFKDLALAAKDGGTLHGCYSIDGENRVHCEVLRINATSTTSTHFFTRLRETKPGASNRLDVVKICLVDDEEPVPIPSEENWIEIDDEEHMYRRTLGVVPADAYDGSSAVRNSNRGLNTLVFVPWEEINTHELNKGVDELDYYITG